MSGATELEAQVIAALHAQRFDHVERCEVSSTVLPIAIRSRLIRDCHSSHRGHKRSVRFELELTVACDTALGTTPTVVYAREAPFPAEQRYAARIATGHGRRLLLVVGGRADPGDLSILELEATDPVVARPADGRSGALVEMLPELVTLARASVRDDGAAGTPLCRITFPVLVVNGPLIECSRLRSGSIRMLEREQAALVWPEDAEPLGAQSIVHIVRDRAFARYVVRARAAFEHLHRHHRRDIERALRASEIATP